MPDIVCPLYDIPDHRDLLDRLRLSGITLRHARSWDRTALCEFIRSRFGQGWADESLHAFNRHPCTAILAMDGTTIVGFACYEVTAPAYFGPTGVDEQYRRRGIGKALYLQSLLGLRNLGYVYGFVGWPGPVDFYLNAAPGLLLPAEWSTIYTDAVGATAG